MSPIIVDAQAMQPLQSTAIREKFNENKVNKFVSEMRPSK
jgi:hypothetical protein